jgi:prophage maintenance system killer protein
VLSKSTRRRSRSSPTSSAPEIKYLTVSDIRDVVHAYIARELTRQEPVPAWETVDLNKLEAALAAPQRSAFGFEPYPELADKAAILLYSMAKAHAWGNGNKRMSFVATLLFLGINGHWWDANSEDIVCT